MSASPSMPPIGPNSTTPSGSTPRPLQRRQPVVNIFMQKKKPVKKPLPQQRPPAPGQVNGSHRSQAPPQTNGVATSAPVKEEVKDYTDFPILVTKNMLKQGLHYHAMKLQDKVGKDGSSIYVNPYDQSQFMRPVHLHRRLARDKIDVAEQSDAASGVDDKDRELTSIKRAERQAEREANQALIAPTGGDSKKPIKKKPQKKVEDVYYDDNNPKHRQRAQLRYEEARPWHLEDFENKNIWVGSYEEPLTDSSVMFTVGQEGFRMFPVEKWYKFTQTNRFNVMDSDTAEKLMNKKIKLPRFMMGTQKEDDERRKQAMLSARAQMRAAEDGGPSPFVKQEEYRADVDEIDFEFNDEFQDDDEGFIFGDPQDDEAKEIEKKIREEMRGANLAGTGVKDEDKDWDEEEHREKLAEHEEKRRTKRMRKQLIKKERKNEYDSESDRGEFSESSESEDSEEERERLEEERKQEEARKLNGDKSGASTKGSNTPTGRFEKKDTAKSLGTSLKRPGSPDLSELSGNESSRKKAKLNGRPGSAAPNGARSLSPDAAKNRLVRTATGGYGSGSDTDTSRAGRPKIRLKRSPPASPHEGTPNGSRRGSPTGSRAQSPQRAQPFPTLEEVRAAIPMEGIELKDLVKIFKQRVAARQPEFIGLVKQAGRQDPATKKIVPKADDVKEAKMDTS